MMEGVVQAGTATVVKEVGKPIAGKTGTTNDEKDAWFIGFSPDIVVGIYVGYDKPRNLGKGATGGHLASPTSRRFRSRSLPASRWSASIPRPACAPVRARGPFWNTSSRAPRRRIITPSWAWLMPMAAR